MYEQIMALLAEDPEFMAMMAPEYKNESATQMQDLYKQRAATGEQLLADKQSAMSKKDPKTFLGKLFNEVGYAMNKEKTKGNIYAQARVDDKYQGIVNSLNEREKERRARLNQQFNDMLAEKEMIGNLRAQDLSIGMGMEDKKYDRDKAMFDAKVKRLEERRALREAQKNREDEQAHDITKESLRNQGDINLQQLRGKQGLEQLSKASELEDGKNKAGKMRPEDVAAMLYDKEYDAMSKANPYTEGMDINQWLATIDQMAQGTVKYKTNAASGRHNAPPDARPFEGAQPKGEFRPAMRPPESPSSFDEIRQRTAPPQQPPNIDWRILEMLFGQPQPSNSLRY